MSIYLQNGVDNSNKYRKQNSLNLTYPAYIRKPYNYIDQYTNDRIPYNFQQNVNIPNIERLTDKSNPTQFFANPEYSTNDLFLTNQIPDQSEAIIRQKIGNEWNIHTQTVTINIDSRSRDFKTEDYENFLQDKRNDVSVQGLWLSSYIFPNNFKIDFNKQYQNIKTVKLTSAIFPNTRSRNIIYIDDTNNYFYVDVVMKSPWLPYNFHIDQTTNLFDFQNFAFNINNNYIKLYKFFQEIEKPYGIPRKITDTTVNNYVTTSLQMVYLNYLITYEDEDNWFWGVLNGSTRDIYTDKQFSVSINRLNNVEYFCKTNDIVYDDGVKKCNYSLITSINNYNNLNVAPYDNYIIEHYCNYSNPDVGLFTISLTHTFHDLIIVDLVNEFPEVLEDNHVYILGTMENDIIIPAYDVVQNGITLSFNRNTFQLLRFCKYTINYNLKALDTVKTIPVTFEFVNIDLSGSLISGNITDISSAGDNNIFLMNGILNGQIQFNSELINPICSIITAKWRSENDSHDDTLIGYSTNIIMNSVQIGYNYYLQVGGSVNYITMSAGVMNNINIYTEIAGNTKYYGTYLQGVPSILGNSLNYTEEYITRAIRDYFVKNNLDYSIFQWSYTNDLFLSTPTVSKISIPYGEYTLNELIKIISEQKIKIKSVKNIITSADNIDYIENVKDNSRYYFFSVVQFQCKLKVTTEYYNNSYLLKFEIDNDSIEPLLEPINISAMGYTHTFTPETVLYDIMCMNVYKYNVTNEIILQNFFTLDPFYFHKNTEPEITYLQTVKNPDYPRYNFAYNVKSTIQDDNLDRLTFYPSPIYMYNKNYVFPCGCSIEITPDQSPNFKLFTILPELPEGFYLDGTTIKGKSDKPFESIHYVYYYYYSGENFRYYQQIKLINAEFKYNYSDIKLLNGFRFKGIQQLNIDSDIIARPFTNITVELDKNWTDISNINTTPVRNVINIGNGINIGYLTGDIYGIPTSEFQLTLNLTGEFNIKSYGDVDIGEMKIFNNSNLLSSDNKFIQSTSINIYSLSADKFYGDNSFMIYSYNYITDDIPQFVCWAKPIKNEINNFISFHIFADDPISNKLLNELHFSYKNSKDIVKTRYLLDYYQPTQVLTMEQTRLPGIRSWTTSYYTENIINHQYNNTTLLNHYEYTDNAVIYPLRANMFGFATSYTKNINVYSNENIFDPNDNLLNRLWYALPGYIKNELNGYIFSQYYIDDWIVESEINDSIYYLHYPKGSFSITPITDSVDRIDPTITQYGNILDFSLALNNINTDAKIYKYCLYNRCKMNYDIIYNPVNIDKTTYETITVPDIYSNHNILSMQIGARINKIEPIVDKILSENDYYNFEDFLWIQLYCDNYGEFENIFDPLTNRWYFAKIFFKFCKERNDVSYNYFECPQYLCKNLNYIQELNSMQVRIYDKYGNLYTDYNSTHYNFSFTLEIEYFIDNIRANGASSKRPTQENVLYNDELLRMQRINNN
jgi:hypothetical protein